eukprot:scaffold92166_cov30-Tisochrysis_lutea.AAC.1
MGNGVAAARRGSQQAALAPGHVPDRLALAIASPSSAAHIPHASIGWGGSAAKTFDSFILGTRGENNGG